MKKNIASDVVIQLSGVSKKYELHHEKPTMVEKFVHGRNETFWALKDIELTVKKGEKIGIIGANGSGKTTLLKIITGITTPTTGSVSVRGKIVSLIDLEAGFHADLNGYDNIFLNGMLLGMSKQEIASKLHEIVAFADIRQFVDASLFTYSEGMKLRLGFAVAVHADPDILILDESISVGDREFRKKSLDKIKELIRKDKTVLFVSHWMDFLKHTCNHIVVLKNGQIHADGSTNILNAYMKGDV